MLVSLSIKQTAAVLGCQPEYVRKLIKRGKLPAFKHSEVMGWKIPIFAVEAMGVPPSIADKLAQLVERKSKRPSPNPKCKENLRVWGKGQGPLVTLAALRTSNKQNGFR